MALYNNGYPAGYQNPYLVQQPQYQQQFQAPQQQTSSGLIWVQGEAAAKSYLVAPNASVALWDSEKQSVYIKSTDASGMPSMKILDYTIRDNTQTPQAVNTVNYATKDDVKTLNDQIAALKAEIDGLMKKPAREEMRK